VHGDDLELQEQQFKCIVDYILKVRRSHFMNVIAPRYSDQLVERAKGLAATAGRTYLYRCGSFRKDQWAEGLMR
jgi:hypothetical protein